jgi:hypothetical protein
MVLILPIRHTRFWKSWALPSAKGSKVSFRSTASMSSNPHLRASVLHALHRPTDSCSHFHSLRYSQNPAFDRDHFPFVLRQTRAKEPIQSAIHIASSQPFGGSVGVLLVAIPATAWKVLATQRRVDFDYCRLARGYLPAIEGPEMYAICHAVVEV